MLLAQMGKHTPEDLVAKRQHHTIIKAQHQWHIICRCQATSFHTSTSSSSYIPDKREWVLSLDYLGRVAAAELSGRPLRAAWVAALASTDLAGRQALQAALWQWPWHMQSPSQGTTHSAVVECIHCSKLWIVMAMPLLVIMASSSQPSASNSPELPRQKCTDTALSLDVPIESLDPE